MEILRKCKISDIFVNVQIVWNFSIIQKMKSFYNMKV